LGSDHYNDDDRDEWLNTEKQLQNELLKQQIAYQPKGLAYYEKMMETEIGESARQHAAADQS